MLKGLSDSLSSPWLTGKTIPRGERKLEVLCDLRLDKDGCTLIALIGILLVDGGMVLLRIVAAFHDAGYELSQLGESVARVVNVSLRLGNR